jgi:transcription antitermination factor NusG
MERYKVLKPLELKRGHVVELEREQAVPRLHNLKYLKGIKYEVKQDISFKVGEIIGFDPGKIKIFAGVLEPVKIEQIGKRK